MTDAYEVHGDRELRQSFAQAADDVVNLRAAAKRTGDLVVGAARTRTPVRSGALAASLRPVESAAGVTIASSSPYAGPIHWGWPARNIRANPFLSDAATRTEETWVGFYFDELQAAVDKVHGA